MSVLKVLQTFGQEPVAPALLRMGRVMELLLGVGRKQVHGDAVTLQPWKEARWVFMSHQSSQD